MNPRPKSITRVTSTPKDRQESSSSASHWFQAPDGLIAIKQGVSLIYGPFNGLYRGIYMEYVGSGLRVSIGFLHIGEHFQGSGE